jgi:uncharacterized membrane protein YhaH (DUF805 family)
VPYGYLMVVAGIRRLHDMDKSGWYLLLAFIPLVNFFVLLWLLFWPGTDRW